jgi:PAS domain S-box-containing protein
VGGGDEQMRNESFICGVFSLLDRMMAQPFDELLKSVPVPEGVRQALVDQAGPYQPFLELVRAVENESLFDFRDSAERLLLGEGEINRAVLRALSAATRLVPDAVGLSLPRLEALFGAPAVAWLQAAQRGEARAAEPPLARLPDGSAFTLAWRRLDSGEAVLRLLPAAASAPPSEPVHAVHEAFRLVWDAPFPATLQDAAFRLVDVNPAYLEFTGHSRDWLIGRDPLELQPAEDRASSLEAREAFLANSALGEMPNPRWSSRRIVAAGGRERWYRATRSALTDDEQGRVLQDGRSCRTATAEHVARERGRPLGPRDGQLVRPEPHRAWCCSTIVGLLVRSNPAFDALAGVHADVTLSGGVGLNLQPLLCWDGQISARRPRWSLLARIAAGCATVWLPQPQGGADLRLRSIVRCYNAGRCIGATWRWSKTAASRKSATSPRCRSAR